MIVTALYHWSPADRYTAIRREGLRPRADTTVSSSPQHHLCFGTSPRRAWALSGAVEWCSDIDQWDLWLFEPTGFDELYFRPAYGGRVEEVNIRGPISPDRLWWAGRRYDLGVPQDEPC